ncbi:hypothetical protein O6H91_24G001100 [Diphasiastrum complanatum]|uniref:Uncharacterized protein n=1 Tax=Diphasiastrum complanatum TaxID=34168 RepID=A0ACC2A743_DIPCM|nr:hypothetical protein O6H91_24G001100 [Diphasiastrum complanatum]
MRLIRRKFKKPELSGKLELEKVIGLTTSNANGLSYNPVTNDVAYLAGYVVVIYAASQDLQTRFLMVSRTPKALSSVAYSPEGKFIAAGESGHQPSVIVWDAVTGSCISELKAHKNGVSCLQFSPNGRHLVSIGVPYDGFLCLWDWKVGALLTKMRVTMPAVAIHSVHFSSDGCFLITAGVKHLKQWTIGGQYNQKHSRKGIGTIPLDGKSVTLGSQKDSSFIGVTSASIVQLNEGECQSGSISPLYALTSSGVLCLLHMGVAVEKWVDLKVERGYGISVSQTHVACACSDGIVRIFIVRSLTYAATLPRPAPHGYHGLTDANFSTTLAMGHVQGVHFPDALACTFLSEGDKLAVVYDDHSLYFWDLTNMSKIGRYRTFLAHSDCIWDITTFPTAFEGQAILEKDDLLEKKLFVTCSADRSIRIWSLDSGHEEFYICNSDIMNQKAQNVYCKNIVGVLYMDKNGEYKDRFCRGSEKESLDSTNGFRAICVSPDGHHLAAGDRSGNVRLYDLKSLKLLSFKEAHDAEILTLDFGTASGTTNSSSNQGGSNISLLASGGRDRLIHVYDVNRDFEVIDTLDDHSASITKMKFAGGNSKLLSCSADRSVVFRHVIIADSGFRSARFHQEIASRGTIYDMDVDPSDKFVVTVGQDKKVNILNLETGKPMRHIKSEGDFGEPVKVRVDPSGTYIVCSYSDKHLRVYDLSSGELLLQASGHAEIITGVAFLPNCQHLISVSGDSCIFVWKLPPMMSRIIRKKMLMKIENQPTRTLKSILKASNVNCHKSMSPKLKSQTGQPDVQNIQKPESSVRSPGENSLPVKTQGAFEKDTSFKFSVSRLPTWAQAKVEWKNSAAVKKKLDDNASHSFESRWTKRLGNEGYKLFTESSEEIIPPPTIHPSGFGARRRFSVECADITLDSTPESSKNSLQQEGSGLSSPKGLSRDAQWKTVHTVFFDEMDFPQDDNVSDVAIKSLIANKHGLEEESLEEFSFDVGESLLARAKSSILPQNLQAQQETRDNDDLVEHIPVRLSKISEEENSFTSVKNLKDAEGTYISNSITELPANGEEEGWETIISKFRHSDCNEGIPDALQRSPDRLSSVGEDEGKNGCILFESSQISASESCDEEAGEDDDFSPRRDLFNTHFDKLSTVVKIDNPASTRSSFSARFFARASLPLPRVALFKSSPPKESVSDSVLLNDFDVENQRECSLAAERERLKLQERQEGGTAERKKQLDEFEISNIFQTSSNLALKVCSDEPLSPSGTLRDEQQQTAFRSEGVLPIFPSSDHQHNSLIRNEKSSCASVDIVLFGKDPVEEDRKVDEVDELPHNGDDRNIEGLNISELHTADFSGTDENLLLEQGQHKEPLNKNATHPSIECASLNATTRDYQMTDLSSEANDTLPDNTTSWTSSVLIEGSSTRISKTQKMLPSLIVLARPKEEYASALQEFRTAADKAMLLFQELQNSSGDAAVDVSCTSTCSSPEILELTQLYQGLLLGTVQNVQLLLDKVAVSGESPSDASDKLSTKSGNIICPEEDNSDIVSETGQHFHSMPQAASSASLCGSLRSSLNIEDLLERYSVRFSETLASQVLALVQKGLDTDSKMS